MRAYLLVAIGGSIGAAARWGVDEAIDRRAGEFPWDTLLVNLLGCLLIGLAARYLVRGSDRWLAVATGMIGGLSTYSTFAYETRELLDTMHDHKLNLVMLDIRSEADYNIFHLLDAVHVPAEDIPNQIDEFIALPANTVFVVMGNDEAAATDVWKVMVAESVPNVYILEGSSQSAHIPYIPDEVA